MKRSGVLVPLLEVLVHLPGMELGTAITVFSRQSGCTTGADNQ